ncbi:hypothetical protein DSO57_1008415 [Entomophthora muscae]|uniref:Uncharacterized protein n=1 Tax=Entomophthora muscae TaxID=34485 RepID=A0ACC2SJT5_9FUNG|nr:hypothetical protein DSO57_1008415 [Entomophthora muscae]
MAMLGGIKAGPEHLPVMIVVVGFPSDLASRILSSRRLVQSSLVAESYMAHLSPSASPLRRSSMLTNLDGE